MQRHFEEKIQDLKERLLYMGSLVERAIGLSIEGLKNRDDKMASEVIVQIEPQINQMQIDIDDLALQLLALQQPMAVDLRMITSAIKINSDLERMGDQATNIAERVLSILTLPEQILLVDIPLMAGMAQRMLKDALDAFVRQDAALAREILVRDDEVDHCRDQIFGELIAHMIKHPQRVQLSLDMLLISRSLERIGDHATNIAEDIIYVIQGRDVRHHAEEKIAP
jgi:phosphate transport system protein